MHGAPIAQVAHEADRQVVNVLPKAVLDGIKVKQGLRRVLTDSIARVNNRRWAVHGGSQRVGGCRGFPGRPSVRVPQHDSVRITRYGLYRIVKALAFGDGRIMNAARRGYDPAAEALGGSLERQVGASRWLVKHVCHNLAGEKGLNLAALHLPVHALCEAEESV